MCTSEKTLSLQTLVKSIIAGPKFNQNQNNFFNSLMIETCVRYRVSIFIIFSNEFITISTNNNAQN